MPYGKTHDIGLYFYVSGTEDGFLAGWKGAWQVPQTAGKHQQCRVGPPTLGDNRHEKEGRK